MLNERTGHCLQRFIFLFILHIWGLFYARVKHINIPKCAKKYIPQDQHVINHIFSIIISFPGPDKWCDNFPIANGPRQSPIDIVPGAASFDAELKPLNLKYDPSTCLDILNNGHSFQVTFVDDSDSSS